MSTEPRENPENYWNPLTAIWDEQPYTEDEGFPDWFNGLTKVQQVLFPTYWLDVEVCNGGFHQYFTNSTGYHAPEAIAGFRELGLHDIADIVSQAVVIFDEPFPRKRDDREKFLAAFVGDDESEWNPFYKLDDAFYQALKIPGAPDFHDDDRFTVAAKKYVSKGEK